MSRLSQKRRWAEGARQREERRAAREAERAARAAARAERVALSPEERRARKLEAARRWRAENPERQKALIRAWYERGGPKVERAKEMKRLAKKARKAATRKRITPEQVDGMWRGQRGRCAYCRGKLARGAAHLDHIEPLARGGEHAARNLQFACAPCNVSKGARDPVEFAQGLGRLL